MNQSTLIVYSAIGVFIGQAIFHLMINPYSWFQEPQPRAQEIVERRGYQAIGIFAVVLLVITFILSPPMNESRLSDLALTTTLVSAGFLMLAFIIDLYAGVNVFLFKLQEDSLSFAGLLLFSGLFFVIISVEVDQILAYVILLFVIIAWLVWLYYKIEYIFKIQRMEWDYIGKSRIQFLKDRFG